MSEADPGGAPSEFSSPPHVDLGKHEVAGLFQVRRILMPKEDGEEGLEEVEFVIGVDERDLLLNHFERRKREQNNE